MLGQGGFGSVYLGFVKKPRLCLKGVPRIVAVKSTLASQAHDLMGEDILLYIFRRCPFVINCYGEDETIGADGRHLFNVFLEYADGGTMADLIEKSRGFGLREFQVRKYTESILKGIKYIHERGFVHCDLKPENILLVSDTAGSSGGARFVPKIGDLGLTKKANQKWEKPSFGDTPMYLSPEAVVYGIQQQPSDIWALGCVVLQMLTGRHPWDFTPGAVFDVRDLLTALLASRIPAIPGWLSKEAKDFLQCCFMWNTSERFTAAMLLNHPFLTKLDNGVGDVKPIKQVSSAVASSVLDCPSFIPLGSWKSEDAEEMAEENVGFSEQEILPLKLMSRHVVPSPKPSTFAIMGAA
ncbi:hypothetical protein CerSpe_112190 [Prunus speciosa]